MNTGPLPIIDLSGKMFMSATIGDGELGDIAFVVRRGVPCSSIIVDVGGGTYMVEMHEIVKAVLAAVTEGS